MGKPPKNSEVLMFGDQAQPAQRAEIISFDADGKQVVENGGIEQEARAEASKKADSPPQPASPKQPLKAAAPAPKAQPAPAKKAEKPAPPPVKNAASAKEMSHALAIDAVGSMVDQMKATAMAKGGSLSLQDIDAMQVEFAAKTKEIEAQFEAAFADFAEARDRLQWDQERDEPFYRLLVKQFSPLFKNPPGRKNPSRRMLPGFFMAADMLLGPDVVERYQERCRGIIARLREESGDDNFDWETFYAARDSLTVCLDAEVLIAAQFEDYDRRINWLMTIVNSHLAPVEASMSEAEQRWDLEEPACRRFLDALFGNLRKVLSSDKGRERLVKRQGRETVAAALAALKKLLTG